VHNRQTNFGDIPRKPQHTQKMTATVQLKFIPKRMLTKVEAAHHCGRSVKRFEVECHVSAVRFPSGDRRYDVRDLDAWLDHLKGGTNAEADEIIGKLK
jgi:hypothetical protein